MARRTYRYGQSRRLSGSALCCLSSLALLIGWVGPEWVRRYDRSPTLASDSTNPFDTISARFGYCPTGGGSNCVVDGDTFRLSGVKYRIADIDTPETHGPGCASEAVLGAQATRRLQALLNDGAFSLETGERRNDRYGRALRIVTRGGRSIGVMLVNEGLARAWDGRRHPWC
ncbi:thermonuclease family protein [Sphingobium sp.]|uniref:thermonuclease family protein n=1 Tax=Sphingobium sp. TaxID=1912891 RepID=UPI003BB5C44A